jgi:EmrB/QacA subfamily drug resistance transporter
MGGSAAFVACDRGLTGAQGGGHAPSRPGLILATCILASSLAFVDGSVVNVALPAIGAGLSAAPDGLQWVINAYLLPLSALLMTGGALGDRFGRPRLLVFGIAVFAAGSAGCAVAPGLETLLAARALQGVGAALLLPSSLAILGDAFQGVARGRAIGAWAAASAVAAAIGPVLGGWLVDTVGWRAIFLINLPLAAAAILLARVALRQVRPAPPGAPLDVAGAVLITLGLAALVWGLTEGSGSAGWTSSAIAAVGAGAALCLAFGAVERARGDRAMMPPALFGSRSLVLLNLMTLLLYGALGGFLVLLPYLLIEAGGYRATAAGAALLPFPLVMAFGGPICGDLAGRFGPRPLLTAGSLLVAFGLLAALRIGSGADYTTAVLPCVLLVALGMTGAAAPLTTAILSSVDGRHTGAASGLNSAVARGGGLIVSALIGGVLAARGSELVRAFDAAAIGGAALAALAALMAWLSADSGGRARPDHSFRRAPTPRT